MELMAYHLDYDLNLKLIRIMEEIGSVSLWLGILDGMEAMENILQTSYSIDGDFEGSEFSRAFEISFYDESCREAEFFEESSSSIEVLLEGFSYDDIIIPRFSALVGNLTQKWNCVVLLYNFRYVGNRELWQDGRIHFKFYGAVAYSS
jgi:hypothetical protein